MNVGWDDLDRELDGWAATGRTATFWWRDDDATAPTPALDRLLAVSDRTAVPVCIAVIPAAASPALAGRLSEHPLATPVQHGWRHENHAPPGAKKAELGGHRPLGIICDEIARGRDRLRELLGRAPLPILVPPWNRIAAEVVAQLSTLGFAGFSVFGARPATGNGPIRQTNCHVDPIDWRGTRTFAGEDRALGDVIRHLRARRGGCVDAREPTGFLTHHLAADEAGWRFAETLLTRTAAHGSACWLTVDEAFASVSKTA